ncbi:cryptochrome/photolyase family protein [Pontibacter cellulosilyticus]|uniref:Deoxyribodipyrimidine photo-lyase n=1 Tax=Pontibacter cellulosilyticus TaxID=1720253 RepID=A0A923SHY5_9BACT|nr:deoxyribodipyrimidine photo-lyase [Pontibacter cellulosilyticus]MBC5992183.1 deoxyribodipyrimidine photo-lyase [Pontibacter cellulosilyticus]
MKSLTIFWFRRDLRLHDNAGFYHALQQDYPVLPLFIFDTDILSKLPDRDDARVSFIHKTIVKLQEDLQDFGSTLLVKYGRPLEIFKELLQEYQVQAVYTNRDYEPYASQRDKAIYEMLQGQGIPYKSFKDQVIFERDEIMTRSGSPYKIYTPYKNTWKSTFKKEMVQPYTTQKHFGNLYKDVSSHIPSLQEMGFVSSNIPTPEPKLASELLQQYAQKRDLPAQDATSRIGPHLRFGTVSVREAVALALQHSNIWLQELIWREFFMQLLYHYPETAEESFYPKFRSINWRNNEEEFYRWCEGKTGFPLVDAGMRELNTTGFMHNRVRMVVASFLVKDLLIDWRWGELYFAQKLLDYEQASNIGNWQWAAGTGADAQPYFRVFNPDSQIKKFDKAYAYIKKWVPEYGTAAYHKPMVDHSLARDRAIAAYKKAISEATAV